MVKPKLKFDSRNWITLNEIEIVKMGSESIIATQLKIIGLLKNS